MIDQISKHKKIYISICIVLLFIMMISIVHCSEFDIKDVPSSVREYLEQNDIVNKCLRIIGNMIYSVLGGFVGMLEKGFTYLAKWDVMSLKPISGLNADVKEIAFTLLPVCLCVCVFIKVMKLEQPLSIIYNLFMVLMFITIFASVMSMAFDLKNGGINAVSSLVGENKNETISDALYRQNTVDIEKSIRKGKVTFLAKSVDFKKFDYNELLDRDVLKTKYSIVNGKETVKELDGGIMGIGKVNYYAYKIDYYALNITLLCSLLVYGFALYKLGYLVGETIKVGITGIPFMVKGIGNLKYVGDVYKNMAQNFVAIVILYFSMMFFSVISSSVMSDHNFDNWLLKALVILALGMSSIAGSGFLNDKMGIDDGSGFALRSMFMGHRIARGMKGAAKTAGNIATDAKHLGDGAANVLSNILNNGSEYLNKTISNADVKQNLDEWQKENDSLLHPKGIENKDIIYGTENDSMNDMRSSDNEFKKEDSIIDEEMNGMKKDADDLKNQEDAMNQYSDEHGFKSYSDRLNHMWKMSKVNGKQFDFPDKDYGFDSDINNAEGIENVNDINANNGLYVMNNGQEDTDMKKQNVHDLDNDVSGKGYDENMNRSQKKFDALSNIAKDSEIQDHDRRMENSRNVNQDINADNRNHMIELSYGDKTLSIPEDVVNAKKEMNDFDFGDLARRNNPDARYTNAEIANFHQRYKDLRALNKPVDETQDSLRKMIDDLSNQGIHLSDNADFDYETFDDMSSRKTRSIGNNRRKNNSVYRNRRR